MSARNDTISLQYRLFNAGVTSITFDDANTLRRAELTLQRWHELECGDGNNYGSWAIERDDNGDGPPFMVHHHYRHGDGPPFMVHHHYRHGNGADTVTRTRIADREAGALRRVAAICKRLCAHYYHQGDPRGCALYVSAKPINGGNRGVACCVD